MKGDISFDDFLAEELRDPGFAAEWAAQAPFRHLPLNVWSLREAKGLTQQELAHAAGMKQPRIAEIERGSANPTLLTLARIAHALGVGADRLIAEPDPPLLASARAAGDRRARSGDEAPSPSRRRTA